METPKFLLTGACLCGDVHVSVTAPPLLTLACHCRDCQKFTASAFSLTAMFPAKSFSYTGRLVRGGLGSEERTHYFCPACKNFIYSQMTAAPERINLRLSLLDDARSYPPFVEVMTDEKMPWASVRVARSYAQGPSSREELHALMDAYAAT
ncbi:GFA family protein [Roseobacteraceae bacterium S113]